MAVPTEDEVRDLLQQFLDGGDYSYGLADVPDAEYDAHYEATVSAMTGETHQGYAVDLPTVPHQFLREAPLVDGYWIDRYIVGLAEWGARLKEKGLFLEASGDYHPLAWHRIIDPADGSEARPATTLKLWHQIGKRLAGVPGRTSVIDERPYLSFEDYSKWKGRRNGGDLKSSMRTGPIVAQWNHWVEDQGGEGAASLAGIKVTNRSLCRWLSVPYVPGRRGVGRRSKPSRIATGVPKDCKVRTRSFPPEG